MIDHNYKITIKEVMRPSSCDKFFIAELSQVHMIVDNKSINTQHLQKEFWGKTQAEAIIRASDSIRHWLDRQALKSPLPHEQYKVMSA